jgi:antitoxin (DNA-binding transcriptional repressor) of toxin-antitoxin stability system
MGQSDRKGVEEARSQLLRLIDAAAAGKATIITKHGRAMAALVPLQSSAPSGSQQSLLPYAGSGKGLWGRSSQQSMRRLRNEWGR